MKQKSRPGGRDFLYLDKLQKNIGDQECKRYNAKNNKHWHEHHFYRLAIGFPLCLH